MTEVYRQFGILPSLASAWNKHGLCDAIPVDALPEAISKKQAELSEQIGRDASEITAVAALLSGFGMAPEDRREFIGNCYGVLFPSNLV